MQQWDWTNYNDIWQYEGASHNHRTEWKEPATKGFVLYGFIFHLDGVVSWIVSLKRYVDILTLTLFATREARPPVNIPVSFM